ncbi:MAG: CotS family spore coat protein [Bacteroidota bacterium]
MSEKSGLPSGLRARLEEQYNLRVKTCARARSAWRIETDAGPRFVKRTQADRESLPFVTGLHDYLDRTWPGIAPRIHRSRTGEAAFQYGLDNYLLLDALPGREADYLNPGDPGAVAAGLAAFHRAARGYDLASAPPSRRRHGSWPGIMTARLADLDRFWRLAKTRGGCFDRAYLALRAAFLPEAAAARDYLLASAYPRLAADAALSREICHHDLAHHNALIEGDTVRFLDLDYAVGDTVLHDLANLCGHLLRLFGWELDPVRAVLARYWAGPPPPAALAVLGGMLLWPQDCWQIGRQFYDEHQPWTEDEFLALLRRKCGKTRARRGFLRRFWREYQLPALPL